jgi:7-cyano-7-deazaguanine synthase in queuosine biosynthesis
MAMCDAIVRSAGMVNLQSSTEMIGRLIQSANSLDCRPSFIFSMGQAMLQGNEGFHNFTVSEDGIEILGYQFRGTAKPLHTPFLHKTKADIAYRALQLNVPFHETWSCYKGGEKHCGKCGTCVERLEAIYEAIRLAKPDFDEEDLRESMAFLDKTEYADSEYWRQAIASRS